MLLKGRTAIVYGASGAVGGAVARAFSREGSRVVLAARRREPLDEVSKDITSHGGLAEVMPVDATDAQAVERHLGMVTDRLGQVNLMFNAISWDDTQGQMLSEMPFAQFFCANSDWSDELVLHRNHLGKAHGTARRRYDSWHHVQCRPRARSWCGWLWCSMCSCRTLPQAVSC